MSSIILRGVAGFGTPSNQSTLGVTFPTSLQAGDFMFAWGTTNASSSYSFTDTADGFNLAPLSATSGTVTAQLFWKIATNTDSATAATGGSYTITLNGTTAPWTVVAGAYGGVNPDNPFDYLPANSGFGSTGTTLSTSSFNILAYNEQLLWFGASGSSGALPTVTAPTGFTTHISQVNTATGSGTQMCALFADKTNAAPGVVPSQVGTLSASHGYAGLCLGLVPKDPMQTFDFESGMQGWTIFPAGASVVQSTDWSRSGTHCAKITTNGSALNPLLIQTFVVVPQTTYYMSAWCYSPLGWSGGTNGFSMGFDCYSESTASFYMGGQVTTFAPFAAGDARSLTPLKFTIPSGCTRVHAYVRWNGTPSTSDTWYVDDIMFGPWPGNQSLKTRPTLS